MDEEQMKKKQIAAIRIIIVLLSTGFCGCITNKT
jgi:hypothetical protein